MKSMLKSRLSIGQRITLLFCLLLLAAILIFGFISYFGVRRAELKSGEDRLQVLSEQLGSMLTVNTHSFSNNAFEIGNSPGITAFLKSHGKSNTLEISQALQDLRKDTLYVKAELLGADRKMLYSSADVGVQVNLIPEQTIHELSLKPDTARTGKLYQWGDSVYFPIVSTVFENDTANGYLIRWRLMKTTPAALTQLKQLLGTGARIFVGNNDGSIWSDLQNAVPSIPADYKNNNQIIKYNRDGSALIAHIRNIENSNWILAVEMPKNVILGAANEFLNWLILIGSLILVTGAFFAWLIGRKVTRPLRKLTTAVSGIAAGNYSTLDHVNRYDELGKLARAFNAMSKQVQEAQKELQTKMENYKILFENSPMPMWIISKNTLDVMNVNKAAIDHFGYTINEFLSLNSTDLRPTEDIGKYMDYIKQENFETNYRGIWRHKKSDGSVVMLEVNSANIIYHDQPARLILANDITDKLNAEAQLVRHRGMEQVLISETTLQVQEKEREELGKELHDNINQILASTKLYLEMARNGNETVIQEAISKSYDNVNLAIFEIRRLSKQLVAPSLETTLIEVIKDLADEIQAITPITTSLISSDFKENLLNDDLKLMLYRVIQEQVNNILKHAAANDVTIILKTENRKVFLSIMDNGIGFETHKKSKGIGLRNIDNRVKFYEGAFSITSQPGKGTRLEVSVPLERKSALSI